MGTIEVNGYVFDGVYCRNLGVYTHEDGHTYAGAHKGGKAHGYGVGHGSNGDTVSAQYANGRWDGHGEVHWVNGDVRYYLWEHGNPVHSARVEANGACFYDGEPCGADHADLAKLKDAAQRATVRTPPTRIQRNARAVGRTATHAASAFARASVLVPRVGPRLSACVCACARVWVTV